MTPYDARVLSLLCELDTLNMNIFLNSFDPTQCRQEGGWNPKAMKYISTKLLGQDDPVHAGELNTGIRWWKDSHGLLDATVQLPRVSSSSWTGMARRERGQQGPPHHVDVKISLKVQISTN